MGRPSVPNLNIAEASSLSPSMRKLKMLRDHILTPGVGDSIQNYIMDLYEDDPDAIEAGLNKSYKIADEYTNLCIEVVQEANHSVEETKKIIDVLIELGANINRWNTANGEYRDDAENALTWAVTHNKGRILQHLIKRGAEAEDAGDHTHLLSHFAGHLSPKQTRKLRRALGGRTPTSAATSREASAGGAPVGPRSSTASISDSGGGGAAGGHGGIPRGTRSRGVSISKPRKTRRTRK